MAKRANVQTSKGKQYYIPMEVTPETIRDFDIDKSEVKTMKIGNKKVRALLVPATEEQYKAYMRPLWCEDKRQQRHPYDEQSLDQLFEGIGYESVDANTDVESDVMNKELIEVLREVLSDMQELDRTIMLMSANGSSEAKIGKAIGMSQRGVGKRKQKAILKLRDLMKDWR